MDVTIAGITLKNVHEPGPTCKEACVIHNPSEHHMVGWELQWRGDRCIFERICPHGIGHPDPDQYPYWKATHQNWQGVHGCDGCCSSDPDIDIDTIHQHLCRYCGERQ